MAGIQCEQCGLDFPIDNFPDLAVGLICEHCILGIDSEQAAKKLELKTKAMADKMLDVKDISELMPKLKTVLGSVYNNFGGPRGFADKVHWMIEQLCLRKPVPASAAQLMIQLMKLHLSLEQTEDHNDARKMSDEQIKNAQQLALMQIAMDAAGDPSKQTLLFKMLEAQGIAAYQMTPEQQQKRLIAEALDREPQPDQ
jgi:hypothetical protein